MAYEYKNHLVKCLNKREAEKIKRLFENIDSPLWSEYSFKDKYYTLACILNDILKIAPWGDKRLPRLIKFVEKQMDITLWDRHHYRWTKPHRGSLKKHINKQFLKYRDQKQIELKEEQEKIKINEYEETAIKLEIVTGEFAIELIEAIYADKVPRDNNLNISLQEAHQLMIREYEEQGLNELANQIKDNPPIHKCIFAYVASQMKDIYLKENDELPQDKLEETLTAQIKKIKKFTYPSKRDTYPKD